ncbi:MAG: DUF2892 domain-containing protein [Gammaproteobacteria bacterium]|nr:DUF2892 domain-containing protein [Gammaproteobacteria bacterium]
MQNTCTLYQNLGYIDRVLRVGVGAAAILAVLAIQDAGTLGWLALIPLLAVYPILTGLIAFDPFYAWIGMDTSRSSVISDHNLMKLVSNITGQEEPLKGKSVSIPGKVAHRKAA